VGPVPQEKNVVALAVGIAIDTSQSQYAILVEACRFQ
jgi:hypothetical protein